MIQHDGLHPNAKAQPAIMELVWEKLEPMLNQESGTRNQGSDNRDQEIDVQPLLPVT